MKKITLYLLLLVFKLPDLIAQSPAEVPSYKEFPIIIGMHWHNFALPLRDIKSNFRHPGAYIGSELTYNTKGNLFQQVQIGGYLNKEVGNGLYLNTQIGWRPWLFGRVYGELKAGLGYHRVFHPTQAYEWTGEAWDAIEGGKSQLTVPLDIGFGTTFSSRAGDVAPFINYQIHPAFFYNATLPFSIHSNILFGLRLKFIK